MGLNCSTCGALALEASDPGLALRSGTRVLLVGDSHTYGAFGRELERLLQASGASVVRRAKIGSAVNFWLPRLPELLREHRPEIVLIGLGANMRGYPSARGTSAWIGRAVHLVKRLAPNAHVVWIGPPRERRDTEAALARFNGIVRAGVGQLAAFVDSVPHTPRYEGRDGVHYAKGAAQAWARGVFAELSRHLTAQPSHELNEGYEAENAAEGGFELDEGEFEDELEQFEDELEQFEDENGPRAPGTSSPVVSPLAQVSRFGLRTQGGKRKHPVYGVIVHTTGSGPAAMARRGKGQWAGKCSTALDCALAIYAKNDGFAHYVIDYQGLVVCTCSEDRVAWHAGLGAAARQYLKEKGPPPWWQKTWGAVARSPLDLPLSGRGPNAQHVGIELLQSEQGGSYTEAQYRSLAALILDIERRHGLKLERFPSRSLLGHEDVNPAPYAQGKIGGRSLDNLSAGWDPGASRGWFSWDKLWALLRSGGGLSVPPPPPAPPSSPPVPAPVPRATITTGGSGAVGKVVAHANGIGMKAYTGQRLDKTLIALRSQSRISITDEQIDLFQRIAEVETGGAITALNTWDSAVVSIGFMQWTLRYGELQHWIERAAPAFARYGIEVDATRHYVFKGERVPAIRGAEKSAKLRWNPWAERFWKAGFDAEIIAVEVKLAIEHLEKQLRLARSWLGQAGYATFEARYRADNWLRAIYHETYNNRPVVAKAAVKATLAKAAGTDAAGFLKLFKQEVLRAYAARNEEAKGVRLIAKTARGAKF
ncbi:MAG TPA: N-acetylmuramoyl-L-alanine amidase [Polyangiaceae bacterium]